jgi:sialate O-acetylesterase
MDFCLGGDGKCRGGAFSANDSVANAKDFPEIRLGTGNRWSPSYNPTDPDDRALRGFSAVCYLTALHIKEVMASTHAKRPMGLFKASVGGTIIEAWSPPDVMASCGVKNSSAHIPSGCNTQKNSDLYLGMVKPAAPFVFSAAFWYQGEYERLQHL